MLNRDVKVQHDDIPEHLGRLIRASEIRVSFQIRALLALREAGQRTAEAEETMMHEMATLMALRRQQVMLYAMMDGPQT